MSENITHREYWTEVASLAKTITEECWDDLDLEVQTEVREANGFAGVGKASESLDERLWETIDSHQWVIYTAYNYNVMQLSDNDGYAAENWGAESLVRDGALNTAAIAFGALYADVLAHPDLGAVDAVEAEE